MEDLKDVVRKNYIEYASYVILDRAIPNVIDGLKPVQRRILYTLFSMDDGKFHKVANIAGQTMAFHPHGDAAIIDALVHIANKNYLLEKQGNFGNSATGDPSAAARYIESKLSPLAKDTLFNKDLTSFVPSYDGRKNEPICLPAKIPLLLMQGAEGIAVGMSTKILPHNFIELLEAQVAILEEKPYTLIPDFPSKGSVDPTLYEKGQGKVKLRAKIDLVNEKTLVIREICYGTTTESLIKSIDDAAKKGKIKIESINDYTAEKVEIEIKLPRGQYAADIIKALYAFTDCEVSISTQCIVIHENKPWDCSVDEVLELQTSKLKSYLRQELEIDRDQIEERIFYKTLEQIFIGERLYKHIETIKTESKIYDTIYEKLKAFHSQLARLPKDDDIERLLNIPIRRISKYDIEKNLKEIEVLEKRLKQVLKSLKNVKDFTIKYIETLIKKYKEHFPRKTKICCLEEVDKRAVSTQVVKVAFDIASGYIGTKVQSENFIECSNFDKILLMYENGNYRVINIPDKDYVEKDFGKIIYAGVADKKSIFRLVYSDPSSKICFAKSFVIKQFIIDKAYRFLEEGYKIEVLSSQENAWVELRFVPKARQKLTKSSFDLSQVSVKSVSAKGSRLVNKAVKSSKLFIEKKQSAKLTQENHSA